MKLPEIQILNSIRKWKASTRPLSFRFCVEALYCNDDSLVVDDGGGVETCATGVGDGVTLDFGGTTTVADELATFPETEKIVLKVTTNTARLLWSDLSIVYMAQIAHTSIRLITAIGGRRQWTHARIDAVHGFHMIDIE